MGNDVLRDVVAGEHVIIAVGGQNDAPGYVLYIGSDGKVHIRRVPGWDPGVRLQLDAAISVLEHAALAKEGKVQQKLVDTAQNLLTPIAQQVHKTVVAG